MMDRQQIIVGQFRGGVPLDRQFEIGRRHAAPVIDHADQRLPALGQCDLDAGGAGIDGVLDQLLDGGGGTFDHFAGGDLVDEIGGEEANRHGGE